MATKRDYYEILGVSKSASADEIKRAYRKEAMQHHPDKHVGDDAPFKELGEAYETLKDPQKRAGYDQYGHAGAQGNPFGGRGGQQYSGGFGGTEGFDFSDILNQFMGGMGGQQRSSGPARGRDLEVGITIDFAEAVFGAEKDVTLTLDDNCDHCHGKGGEPGSAMKTCATCKGAGRVMHVQQTILGAIQQQSVCPICHGSGQMPEKPCTVCNGVGTQRKQRTIKVKIPAGVDNGSTMRLPGKGAAPKGGGTKGDLFIAIRVRADKRYERDGTNIHSEVKLAMADAALGAEIPVETVDGEVKLKIPAGTQSGKQFRLSGRGVPRLNATGRGDHIVHVAVETPTKLSPKQRALLEQFASEGDKKGFWKK